MRFTIVSAIEAPIQSPYTIYMLCISALFIYDTYRWSYLDQTKGNVGNVGI
jgi:hypothetical protein